MKKAIGVLFFIFCIVFNSNAQNDNWLKTDNENLFSDCKSYTSKYTALTEEQRESLCMCYYKEINKKYSKSEYQAMLDIEVKRIREATISQCAKNSSYELSDKKEEAKADPKKDESSVLKPTKENLIGHWKDDEADIWLFETGDYKIQYNSGKSAKGTWKIDGEQLSLYKEKMLWSSEKVFKILIFTTDKFVYQSLKSKSDTFTATRVK